MQDPKCNKPHKMKEVVTADDMNVDSMKVGSVGTSGGGSHSDSKHGVPNVPKSHIKSKSVLVPEGRVHGGSLMAMLAGGSGLVSNNSVGVRGDSLETEKSCMMPQSWM